jgi:decaprenyl-phosphate phosphoribosyltransferase
MKKIELYLKLLRVHQWVKNLFIFLPPFFALKLKSEFVLEKGIIAFFAFSMIASATYIFNDMLDINADMLHPTKCKRPLASKEVSFIEGIILIAVLLLLSSYLFVFVIKNPVATFIATFYLLQNILYTIKLKHIAILDVVIISIGFVLRILLGGAVTNTQLSHWIILMTFVFALFLALAKRRDDVINFIQTGNESRKNVQGYNLEFLNVSITVIAAVVVVCYIMYCTSSEVIARFGDYVYLTSFFVILGILKYLQLTFVQLISGNPTLVLLKNRYLQLIILGWILSFVAIIYIKP